MKSRLFEASIGAHALAWPANGSGATASATPSVPAPAPQATTGTGLRTPALSSMPPAPGTPGSAKFDFPSATSIPPVSIMNAEPGAPPEGEARPAPAPKRPAAPARRQTAREAMPAPLPPQRAAQPIAPPPPPPVQAAPALEVVAPPEPATHDPHATH